jgi:hypothetical protein
MRVLITSGLLLLSAALNAQELDVAPVLDAQESNQAPTIEEILNTDTLPDLTPEMITAILLSNAPQKPEWILQIKKLKEQLEAAQKAKIKKYTDQFLTTVIPYSSQKSTDQIILEPYKYATISFIDAAGLPFDVATVKPSNPQFEILTDGDINPDDKAEKNHFIIRAISDYAEANLLVYLRGYEYPILVDVKTGPELVDRSRTFKVMTTTKSANKGQAQTVSSIPSINNQEMRDFLIDPPLASIVVPVRGDGVDVYKFNDAYYVVTRYEINSAYSAVDFGTGGRRVYKVSPDAMLDQLMFTFDGQLLTVDVLLEDVSNG